MKIYTEFDSGNIPKSPGVYAFYLNCITPQKLGLVGEGPFEEKQLMQAKKNLNSKVSSVFNFMHSLELKGDLINTQKRKGIAEKYTLQANQAFSDHLIQKIKNISLDYIIPISKLLESVSIFCQPIYVGITIDQTLYSRYKQHENDFEREIRDDSKFGGRLKNNGIEWDEISFTCIEFPVIDANDDCLKTVEDYLLIISKPILSKN